MSGYLMEPFKDIEDFKGAVRNVRNGKKGKKWSNGGYSKETAALAYFFSRLWESIKVFWTSGA